MTWEQMQKTLENCLEFCRAYDRLPYFYITGGDPILHPDFWRLLERLHELRIPFTILGNPFHLDDAVCRRLKALGCEKYQLSLDGMEKTHDWFRKPGSFASTLEKIGCINRAGIRSVIMTTVSGTNIDEVPDIVDAVVQRGRERLRLRPLLPDQRGKGRGDRARCATASCWRTATASSGPMRRRAARRTSTRRTTFGRCMHTRRAPSACRRTREPGMIYGGCNCGNCHLTILPTGEVYACRRVQNSRVGNVFADRLVDLWIVADGCLPRLQPVLPSAQSANCWPTAGDVRRWPAGGTGTFTPPDPQCWKEVE